MTNMEFKNRERETLMLLNQAGNKQFSPAKLATLAVTMSQWQKDRARNGTNPTPKKAVMLSTRDMVAVMRRLRCTFNTIEYKRRLNDARMLVTITAASGCRARDMAHRHQRDATIDEVNGSLVLEFKLRFSKSNRDGSRLLHVVMFQTKRVSMLCPVAYWQEFLSRNT